MKYMLLLVPVFFASCHTGTPNNVVPETTHEKRVFSFLEKFDRFDYNGDGKLTKKEIWQGIREMQIKNVTKERVDKWFAEFDTNHDGRITFAEAQGGMRREISNRDEAPKP